MTKPLSSGENLPFPQHPPSAPPAQSYNKDAAFKKAHNAFHAAKGRCNNPNNKDYPDYGGAGIQFHLNSVPQLIELVGLPKQKDSLDRLNPHGHYEPGNVRWASSAAQASNKKNSKGGALPTLADLVAHHEAAVVATGMRHTATEVWDRVLKAYRRCYFTPDDAQWLAASGMPLDLYHAGWDFDKIRDLAKPPSFFHLPSLTWPGKVIRLRGGPFAGPEKETSFGTFIELSGDWNIIIPKPVAKWINEGLERPDKHGSAWVGQVSPDLLRAGGVEGVMLTAASRLRYRSNHPVDAAFYPCLRVLGVLDELGGPWKWDDEHHPVLDSRALFIPDLQIDVGGGEISTKSEADLAKLLEYRRQMGFRTFVGVQNPHKLGKKLAREVLGHLAVHKLNPVDWEPIYPSHLDSPKGMTVTLPATRLRFSDMAAMIKTGVF
jgi:hypothetical protein